MELGAWMLVLLTTAFYIAMVSAALYLAHHEIRTG